MFIIDLETPPGSNLAYTRAKAQEVARIARKRPEVAYTYTSVSAARATPWTRARCS